MTCKNVPNSAPLVGLVGTVESASPSVLKGRFPNRKMAMKLLRWWWMPINALDAGFVQEPALAGSGT
jgi:hypothetical protein